MARLVGPDKRHINASIDIHLSFFIVLSDFFFKKNAVSLTLSTQNNHNGSFTTICIQR